jgi:hypothetical protein
MNIFTVKEKSKTSITHEEFQPLWMRRYRVGKTVEYLPMNIVRKIAGLETPKKRTKEDKNTLKFLGFQKKKIIKRLMERSILLNSKKNRKLHFPNSLKIH